MTQELNFIAKDERFKTAIVNGEEYPNYLVSNYGRVYSQKHKKFLKPYKDKKGYLKFQLYKDGKYKHVRGHRLVGFAFVPNPENNNVMNHKDECRTNNKWTNLEWCTQKYNANYGNAQAKKAASLSKPVIKMNKKKRIIAEYPSLTEASKKTKIPSSTLSRWCLSGKSKSKYLYEYREAS